MANKKNASEKKGIIPVIKNNDYTMMIDDIGVNGEGIGKIDGYTLFVPGGLPGDTIKVKVTKVKKNFGFGRLEAILQPSLSRVEAPCQSFGRCGGCQIQHLDYKAQLDFKKEKVKGALEHIAGLKDVHVHDTIGMEEPFYYRNKAQFPVGMINGNIEVGFYAPRSHRIIPIEHCYIQHRINETIIAKVKEYMNENAIEPYDETRHTGLIRHVVTRWSQSTGDVHVTLVINGKRLPKSEQLIQKLTTIDGISGISFSSNKEKTNVILGEKVETIWGNPTIRDVIGDIYFDISPLSFYQVNPIQTEKLYEKALAYADLTGGEIVWDAYCGIGTISLFLAKQAKKVYGVEIVSQAIEDAKHNAKINKIQNVEFYVGKAEEVIPEVYRETGINPDVIVVDPPRKGCDQALLNTMIEMQPERIVYVSCDPSTMARDVKVLVGGGYEVVEVQPVDMFAHTVHVEAIIKMTYCG